MPIDVFLSVGRTFNGQQHAFVASVAALLARNGLSALTVATADAREDPLRLVMSLMDRCGAAVIIALERLAIDEGREWRGAAHERAIAGASLPTPWNQIEGALAYAKALPVLVLKENGVRAEGLLEAGWQRYIHSAALAPDFLEEPAFRDVYGRWLRDVRHRARRAS